MDPVIWVWLGLVVIFAITEIATTSLTTIWFAGGALVAFIMALFHAPLWADIVVFLVVSLILLFFTRPLITKVFKVGTAKTNVDSLIGKNANVIVEIDNNKGVGYAVVDGQEWTARSEDDAVIIPEDSVVTIVGISGVKLIVRELTKKGE
ncbi:MAG: NfeD family protein [Butyrivibrio sp.]